MKLARGVLLIVLGAGIVVPARSEDRDLKAAFERDVETYRALPDAKALALAVDEHGAVWGWDSGRASIREAMTGAFDRCGEQARTHGVEKPCKVVMLGNALFDAPGEGGADPGEEPESAPAQADPEAVPAASIPDAGSTNAGEIAYSDQWIEGRRFVVGSSADSQVWVSVDPEDRSRLLVYLVNGSQEDVTLDPAGIRASFWKTAKPQAKTPVAVYSAEEWTKSVKRRQAFAAAMAGVAAGLNSVPQPQTSYYQGRVHATGPGGTATGTFYGAVTTWPTWQDYADAQARSQAQLQAVGRSLRSSYEALTANLLQHHTLTPQSYYGGVVHLRAKLKGDRAYVRVPFGGTDFEFEVEVPRR